MNINKLAKPIPKLDLPQHVHLQKASKIKQIWQLWSMNVAFAMSTWNDIAVVFWHQAYHQSESSYQDSQRFSMFAYERCHCVDKKFQSFLHATRLKHFFTFHIGSAAKQEF